MPCRAVPPRAVLLRVLTQVLMASATHLLQLSIAHAVVESPSPIMALVSEARSTLGGYCTALSCGGLCV